MGDSVTGKVSKRTTNGSTGNPSKNILAANGFSQVQLERKEKCPPVFVEGDPPDLSPKIRLLIAQRLKSELATWTKSKSATPTENETAFVIGYDIDQDNGRFRIVYSSVKLLSLFRTLDVLSADCTFKTTMQGYPLMVVCLVDKMRHAHPVAFATVTKQEKADYDFVFSAIFDQCSRLGIDCTVKAFISDGEIALKKAARSVFGEHVLMINCYFHVVQNIKKHITKNKTIPAECKETILKRVAQIQVSPTQLHFETACSLFLKEYKQFPDFVIRELLDNSIGYNL
ncbi:uncharacterized protein LOC134204581 [Armigeres subalbatus]|uniref:uncharacterized protein LOC134204581 n=1 Tax=Armigeres subalbatus TaxID=124917 RepID=UPI002ED4321A